MLWLLLFEIIFGIVAMFRIFLIAPLLLVLSACSSLWKFPEEGKVNYMAAPPCFVNTPTKISLLNPMSKYIVHCYSTPTTSSEECALIFERKGYVRYRDIPYKTASYDFLHRGTYPTRRWRDGERTPRW